MFQRTVFGVGFLTALMVLMPLFQNAPLIHEGDVFPPTVPNAMPPGGTATDLNGDGDALDVGEFGDGTVNMLDSIMVLRAVVSIPGYVPPAGSDLFDAMDVYPADVPGTRGGNGIIDNLDLILVEAYDAGTQTPTTRLPRFPWAKAMPWSTSLWAGRLKQATGTAQPAPVAAPTVGTVVFDLPSIDATGTARFGVYLSAPQDVSLAGIAHGFGVRGNVASVHFDTSSGVAPTIQDEALAGITCVAWLKDQAPVLKQGQRLQLGTLTVTGLAGQPLPAHVWLDVYGISAAVLPAKIVLFNHPQSIQVK
jgi:hypothetical protein